MHFIYQSLVAQRVQFVIDSLSTTSTCKREVFFLSRMGLVAYTKNEETFFLRIHVFGCLNRYHTRKIDFKMENGNLSNIKHISR